MYYNDINLLEKYEFQEMSKKRHIYQQPRQLLLRNMISKNTIYDNILLYHSLGTGKTISSIGIAEGFKEYINNIGRRIIVLVKNGNIEENFRNELNKLDIDDYQVPDDPYNVNKINRKINKIYNFITYGSFVNRTLGSKVYKKDDLGLNTNEVLKDYNNNIIRKIQDPIDNLNNTVIIIDEAHNVTNNDVYLGLKNVLSKSYNYRLVLLTATPMYDNTKEFFEISNLLNMNNPDYQLPIRNELYKPFTFNNETGVLLEKSGDITDFGKKVLKQILNNKISYLNLNTDNFAKKIDIGNPLSSNFNVIYCKMSDRQFDVYEKILKSENSVDEDTISSIESEDNMNESYILASNSLYKNHSDISTMIYPGGKYGKDGFLECFDKKGIKDEYRYILTTHLEYYSKKLFTLLQNVKKSPGNVFIYSNYVNFGGVELIKQLLSLNGFKLYTGGSHDNTPRFVVYEESLNVFEREKLRNTFNSDANKHGNIIKIIIGSPIISEGITLKNIRQVHILEPSWNMSRINQIIGRAVRFKSHVSLEPDERNVEIYKYVSIHDTPNVMYIDKYKYELSEKKDIYNKKIERILKQVAFDCSFNVLSHTKNGSPECDYQDCDFTCDNKIDYPVISKNDFNKRSWNGENRWRRTELNEFANKLDLNSVGSNQTVFNRINQNFTSKLDKSTYNMFIDFFEKYNIDYIKERVKDLFKEYYIWSIDDIIEKIQNSYYDISVESIYTVLIEMISNKTLISDKYTRNGFLIQRDNFIIFNPSDHNIDSSIFSKIFDFNKNENLYDLETYIKKYKSIPKKQVIEKQIKRNINTNDITLSDQEYNDNIKENYKVYGTSRDHGILDKNTGIVGIGVKDNIFRLVDTRKFGDTHDTRKIPKGMNITSKKLKDLIEYIIYFNVDTREFLTLLTNDNTTLENISRKCNKNVFELSPLEIINCYKISKSELVKIVTNYLINHNMVLK